MDDSTAYAENCLHKEKKKVKALSILCYIILSTVSKAVYKLIQWHGVLGVYFFIISFPLVFKTCVSQTEFSV